MTACAVEGCDHRAWEAGQVPDGGTVRTVIQCERGHREYERAADSTLLRIRLAIAQAETAEARQEAERVADENHALRVKVERLEDEVRALHVELERRTR